MNNLEGSIKDIKVYGNLSLVKVAVGQLLLTSIVIETPDSADYLKLDAPINVMFKETEVIIGASASKEISLQNQIPVSIVSIDQGVLLTELTLDFQGSQIRSIITTNAVDQLKLAPGGQAVAMIKTNEVMLSL